MYIYVHNYIDIEIDPYLFSVCTEKEPYKETITTVGISIREFFVKSAVWLSKFEMSQIFMKVLHSSAFLNFSQF